MRDKLIEFIDKPVSIRTLPGKADPEPIQGTVFEVHDESVDLLIDAGIMKSIQIGMIIDVSLSHFYARGLVLEDPPDHADYLKAKRALFQAEEYINLQQPQASIAAKAATAAELFRTVRAAHPDHKGVARRLQRAHFLATGGYDYESYPDVTGGDLDNDDYAAAKEQHAKLEKALKARRPEGEIAVVLRNLARPAARALALYPNHADLKAWFEQAETIRQKLTKKILIDNDMNQPFEPVKMAASGDGESGIVKPPV